MEEDLVTSLVRDEVREYLTDVIRVLGNQMLLRNCLNTRYVANRYLNH